MCHDVSAHVLLTAALMVEGKLEMLHERVFDQDPAESYFSALVNSAGCYKPPILQAAQVLSKVDCLQVLMFLESPEYHYFISNRKRYNPSSASTMALDGFHDGHHAMYLLDAYSKWESRMSKEASGRKKGIRGFFKVETASVT